MKTFTLSILILCTSSLSTQAENLNRKFGPSWNCSYLSFNQPGLNRDCKVCQDRGQEFDQTDTDAGQCVPKHSLRESGPSPAQIEAQERQEKIDDAVRERNRQQSERMRNMPRARDSDVTGTR